MSDSSAVPYRIGVVADTHNRWLPKTASVLQGVDEIWHLGDVCKESILDELRAITPRLTVVLGNNDFLDYPLHRTLDRFGEKFYLTHIEPKKAPPGIDWLLHAHTHLPRFETLHGIRYFNPGVCGGPSKGAPPSVGLLIRPPDGSFNASFLPL